LIEAGKSIWRRFVPQSVRRSAHVLVQSLAKGDPEKRVLQSVLQHERPVEAGPILVSGLVNESKGVSQAARLTVAGLASAGFAPGAHDLRPTLSRPPDGLDSLPGGELGGPWILHANPPEALHAFRAIGPASWRSRRRIGYWSWELPRAPAAWVTLSRAFHELWVPSRFVADALVQSGVSTPILVAPHPVALSPLKTLANRAKFGIGPNVTAILAMGDLNSSADRKNLVGAIEIYLRTFPEAQDQTVLILKTQADGEHPNFGVAAVAAARGRPDIRFVSGTLHHEQVHSLIASSDIFLSPHRSEGFGLSLGEAFLLGVPALATGWSGNLDFMQALPELLIAHSLVPAEDSYGVYEAGNQMWAEPDIADAAVKLRRLADDPALRKRLAAAGRLAVEELSRPWQPDGLIAQAVKPYVLAAQKARCPE
jgi:glycosyltransferase involved in cell wall biosynthesis